MESPASPGLAAARDRRVRRVPERSRSGRAARRVVQAVPAGGAMSKPHDSPAVDWRKEAEDLGILLNESRKEVKALRGELKALRAAKEAK